MSSFGKFTFGALVGGAIGATIALLLAPKTGEETRQLLKEEMSTRYGEVKDQLSEKADEVRTNVKDKVDEVSDSVKTRADELLDKAKTLTEELEETGRDAITKTTSSRRKTAK